MTIGKLLRKILIFTFILKVSAIPFAPINRNNINFYPQLKTGEDGGKYKLEQNGNYQPLNGINLQRFRNLKSSNYLPADILNILSQINDVENQQNDNIYNNNNDDELWNNQKFDENQYGNLENFNDKQENEKWYGMETIYPENRRIDNDFAQQTQYEKNNLNVPMSLNSLKYQNKLSDDRLYNLKQTDAERISSQDSRRQETNDIKKRQYYWKSPLRRQEFVSTIDRAALKRNALAAFKRQKFKSHQTQFIPSISVEAMTHLGDFFGNLKNNVEFMETGQLSHNEGKLLEGHHPDPHLSDNVKPTGTAAFLHAVRSYRPSQRIRSLVSMTPDGYHGSQFLDPNYMWVGLG